MSFIHLGVPNEQEWGMDEADIAAVARASNQRSGAFVRSTCGTCERPMYREPVPPGVPSEWRHTSSGHSISWNPERHIASETNVEHHAHRFVAVAEGVKECEVEGCGSSVVERRYEAQGSPSSKREAKAQASRQRGTFNSRISPKSKVG